MRNLLGLQLFGSLMEGEKEEKEVLGEKKTRNEEEEEGEEEN